MCSVESLRGDSLRSVFARSFEAKKRHCVLEKKITERIACVNGQLHASVNTRTQAIQCKHANGSEIKEAHRLDKSKSKRSTCGAVRVVAQLQLQWIQLQSNYKIID